MTRTCPHCGSCDIDEDAARGDATCMECGTVLEESIVVSENQFQERAGGSGHTLVGQYVSLERGQTHSLQGVPGLGSQESREVTFQKGRKLIEEVASQLRINQHCMDTSFNFFKMCVVRNLTRGRIRSHVVAACLYMTCRIENTPHLLLDFSDVTQVNVFDLGRTLSFISRSLKINMPPSDPCLYVMRFACVMELGDKQKEVVTLATRLVQRMKRDWLAAGRRPTGLCGAALLIAARSHNFNRSIADIVRIVHISESVVRKRLEEFSQTPSSALTIDEFSTVDLEHCEDPPAFREARRKNREQQLAKENEAAERFQNEMLPLEEEVEKALEKKRREKFKSSPYAKVIASGIEEEGIAMGNAEAALLRNDIIDTVYTAVDENPNLPSTSKMQAYGPSLESLGITRHSRETTCISLPPSDHPNGELNLEGIDDDEIDTYLLTESESLLKERFWMKVNGDHMREVEKRQREREEQDEGDKDNPKKRRRRNNGTTRSANGQSASAMEAMEKVIHEKKLSNKVNYDILKEIEGFETELAAPKASNETTNVLLKPKKEVTSSPSVAFGMAGVVFDRSSLSRREREIARKNDRTHGKASVLSDSFDIALAGEVPKKITAVVLKSELPMNGKFEDQKPQIPRIENIETTSNASASTFARRRNIRPCIPKPKEQPKSVVPITTVDAEESESIDIKPIQATLTAKVEAADTKSGGTLRRGARAKVKPNLGKK